MTKRDDNWTDFERPCFDEYDADPMSMTKEEFIAQADTVCECYQSTGAWGCDCRHLFRGGRWENCSSGGLSRHCPESLKPKEATDANA